jgi:hypothetical protein
MIKNRVVPKLSGDSATPFLLRLLYKFSRLFLFLLLASIYYLTTLLQDEIRECNLCFFGVLSSGEATPSSTLLLTAHRLPLHPCSVARVTYQAHLVTNTSDSPINTIHNSITGKGKAVQCSVATNNDRVLNTIY